MRLANIKRCRVTPYRNFVFISGVDKNTNDLVLVSAEREGFEEWIKGIPIKYALPELSQQDREFLSTGCIPSLKN